MPAELYSGGHACPDALSNQFELKLGKGSDHVEEHSPCWQARVERLGERSKLGSLLLDPLDDVESILERSGYAVEFG
ncbi:hypothetical protein RSp0082 [Ralstonia pseudosolanacearum GMI1000]|uniref:Uncharacterized protein n=1 Tax=Ralstonia nicotianae (strain ATCC BAA-1114 / GMI1000) TaxID=267608 RepID=Q8XTM4_RALN1|nr:hypothetical protein RSp0082 [Ralstonia pseudosolanacearum GMI1000]